MVRVRLGADEAWCGLGLVRVRLGAGLVRASARAAGEGRW